METEYKTLWLAVRKEASLLKFLPVPRNTLTYDVFDRREAMHLLLLDGNGQVLVMKIERQ
jgi:hypothetical protein